MFTTSRIARSLDNLCSKPFDNKRSRLHKGARRGAAAILGICLIGIMTVLLSMTIDLSYIHNSQGELKRTSDAAALAGGWQLFDSKVNRTPEQNIASQVRQSAQSFSMSNSVANEGPQLSTADVLFGQYDAATQQFTVTSPTAANAIRVDVHRQANQNGQVKLFFGSVLGRSSQPMSVSSTAALNSNIRGFYTPASSSTTLDILPFALDVDTWNAVLRGDTADSFSWNGSSVVPGSDGLHECNLYPQGTGSPGNRGTVDIGSSNNSTSDLARQIVSGISRQDLLAMQTPLEFNNDGELLLNGDTGISAGVKDELASIIGQKRIIPIFRKVTGNGNNAMYTIVQFAGVRILEVRLTGSMSSKRVIVEPAPIVAHNAKITTDSKFHSDFVFSPVMLVK